MAVRVALLCGLLMVSALSVSATDHIVGGNRGWNIGVNYTDWINAQTFVLEDWISFRYQKDQHNVLQVNQSGYDNCTTDNPIANWSSGKDFMELNESKRYWYIDGKGGCFAGMKVTFKVNKTASAPQPSAANTSSDSKASDAADCLLRPGVPFFSALSMFVGALLTI
ncbi:hypothetical protein SUGI_0000970 [Cryptomeria japonica]|uniref:early nodulin-like protein 17 n=1 Tax=Cryptomeria japonica TaxID=3369 RepID=UPI002408ABCD|nr:early nodulin-like protein 17 [Cryptomeria japonica]GLJ04669.1 hypothetical protein SUGI_0000970 [Cryptomeria japonica]